MAQRRDALCPFSVVMAEVALYHALDVDRLTILGLNGTGYPVTGERNRLPRLAAATTSARRRFHDFGVEPVRSYF
jgi:hypothetical protein